MANMLVVVCHPYNSMKAVAKGMVISPPAPMPVYVIAIARLRLRSNQRAMSTLTGTATQKANPKAAIISAAYSSQGSAIQRSRNTPNPNITPPNNITGCEPYLSVILPAPGEARATARRLSENALEMVPRPQPKVSDQDSKKMRAQRREYRSRG